MPERDPDHTLQAILDRIATGTHTEADLATLRRALLVGGQGNVIQIGKYNVKIGEGQDIRIGDTVYQGPDADAIQVALREVLDEVGWRRRFGVPFQAPPLAAHFVPRPEVTDALKVRLLTEAPDTPGVLVVSAIHGLGGIGKSTLAAALCCSPDVQERFPDGILWATLGQQPEQLPLLTAWIQALGDYQFHPITAEAASTHLRTLLHDKAALLVVDDVWNAEHGRPFLVGGLRCRVLITTRRANVADEVGADLHELDVMTPDQSLGLLVARLGRALDDAERSEALHLAKAVGHLPLALELAAARVRAGVTWADLRLALETEVARLGALEGPRGRRRGQTRLEASFNLSLDALRRDDEAAWRAFAWLGLLPEAVSIAAPTAATLWEMSQAEAAGLLEFLDNEALLLPAVPVPIGGQAWAAYRVHDLLHDIARRMLTANLPRGLGLTLEEAHVALLERYRATVPDDRWYMLRDDGYIHAHLTWHMEQARASKAIHDLLRQENVDGQNGWWVASEKFGQTGGYLQDVERAWGLAGQTCEKDGVETPQQVGLQIRYTLMAASVKSMARSMPVALLTALLRTNAWNPSQVLFYAYQISDHSQRSEALASIAMQLYEMGLIDLALQALHEVDDESWRATAFAGLASKVPVPVATTTALRDQEHRKRHRSSIRSCWTRCTSTPTAETRGGIGDRVTTCALRAPRSGARSGGVDTSEPPREVALRGIVPSLPQALTDEALALAKEMPDANVFKVLMPFLSKNQLREVLRFIEGQPLYINAHAAILADLARFLSATELAAPIRRAYHLACGMAHRGGRLKPEVWAVCWLAPCFPANGRREALSEALSLASSYPADWRRVEMLVELCPHLPQELRVQALERILQSIEQNEFLARDRVLGKPAPTDYLEGCARMLVDLLVRNDDIFHAVRVAMQIDPKRSGGNCLAVWCRRSPSRYLISSTLYIYKLRLSGL